MFFWWIYLNFISIKILKTNYEYKRQKSKTSNKIR